MAERQIEVDLLDLLSGVDSGCRNLSFLAFVFRVDRTESNNIGFG